MTTVGVVAILVVIPPTVAWVATLLVKAKLEINKDRDEEA